MLFRGRNRDVPLQYLPVNQEAHDLVVSTRSKVLNTWHSAHTSSIIKKEKILPKRTGRNKHQKMNDDDINVKGLVV